MNAVPTAPTGQAARTLGKSPIPLLRRLHVEETADAVILTGRVPSYYLKQLAQESVLPHLLGRGLHNRIEVVANNSNHDR